MVLEMAESSKTKMNTKRRLPYDSFGGQHELDLVMPPDAIQLACAASVGIDLFITNDDRLSRKNIPGINFITSLARAPI